MGIQIGTSFFNCKPQVRLVDRFSAGGDTSNRICRMHHKWPFCKEDMSLALTQVKIELQTQKYTKLNINEEVI